MKYIQQSKDFLFKDVLKRTIKEDYKFCLDKLKESKIELDFINILNLKPSETFFNNSYFTFKLLNTLDNLNSNPNITEENK